MSLDLKKIPTPCYVCEETLLERNLKILDRVQRESGAKILLALKGFNFPAVFPLVRKYLHGCCASGLYEARLAHEEFRREVHTFSPAYRDDEFAEILKYSHHVVFNSFNQWLKFKNKVKGRVSPGLRVNPETSSSPRAIYDPCGPTSRLGITRAEFRADELTGIEGLHFHALCEQNSHSLEKVLHAFEKNFGEFIPQMKWINFGGGHWITEKDYDVAHLIRLIKNFRQRWNNIPVYLEPGEAVGWQTGPLVASVVDIVRNKNNQIAILDTSFANHMPDTLEMPYTPRVRFSGEELKKKFKHGYLFGGPTCLAGDYMNHVYTFARPLRPGDKIIFEDMLHYTFVKSTMFNGIRHPSLAVLTKSNKLKIVRKFTYADFRARVA